MFNQINFNTKIITIDGPAASGKSTAGAFLSKKVNFSYLDTGLMYRAITAYFIDNNILPEQLNEINKQLENMNFSIKFTQRKTSTIFVNNYDVMSKLFIPKIDLSVSKFSLVSVFVVSVSSLSVFSKVCFLFFASCIFNLAIFFDIINS